MSNYNFHVGIDVAKDSFDVCIDQEHAHRQFGHDRKGIAKAVRWIASHNTCLVVIEATGNYQVDLVDALFESAVAVAVVNPRQVRDFAKAMGTLAKTDKIDAAVLAEFAKRMDPKPTTPKSEPLRKLRELTSRQRNYTKMINQEKNRLGHARNASVTADIRSLLRILEGRRKKIDAAIEKHIESTPDFRATASLLVTTPGIGMPTAAVLIAELPELGTFNRKEVAKIAGVAPHNRESGKWRGKQKIGGGRRRLRSALYMPMLSAIQHNPVLHAFYHHLLEAGKLKMAAIMACERKLLVILNAMLATQQPWRTAPAQT